MPAAISKRDRLDQNGSTFDVESIRQHFPALRGERIPLNNASGSVAYDGAVKA